MTGQIIQPDSIRYMGTRDHHLKLVIQTAAFSLGAYYIVDCVSNIFNPINSWGNTVA
jgi:hypothetical protein